MNNNRIFINELKKQTTLYFENRLLNLSLCTSGIYLYELICMNMVNASNSKANISMINSFPSKSPLLFKFIKMRRFFADLCNFFSSKKNVYFFTKMGKHSKKSCVVYIQTGAHPSNSISTFDRCK